MVNYIFKTKRVFGGRNSMFNGDQNSLFKKSIYLIFIAIFLILTACGTTTTEPEESTTPVFVEEARSWLATQLNVSVSEIEVVSIEQVDWTDSCFGLGGPAESCAAVITPGWQANFEVNGQQYEVRFDEIGTSFRSPQFP